MKPLKVAFIWHQHQPYYKMDGEFIMPWVRMHGVKDYLDLAQILHEFPKIKQTFNLVPSLLLQIDEYLRGASDNVQRLSKIPAENLSLEEKERILEMFFMCNIDRMVMPYSRFRELYEMSRNSTEAMEIFSLSEWRDLQTWYNLCWIGEFSREEPSIKRLFNKGKYFTEKEKLLVLDYHIEILARIKPQMKLLNDLEQIELCCSPFYHPIIPLVIDSKSALESNPKNKMPNPLFSNLEDAKWHIEEAKKYFKESFGSQTNGMWPSEGSISNDALSLFAQSKIKWVATDEAVLKNSIGEKFRPTEKFFPRKYSNGTDTIDILFRDHFLSDRIGFMYSTWNEYDAANEFCHHIHQIRNEIIRVHGDEALDYAVLPVILDGENCWEYYPSNGLYFLRQLYANISGDGLIKTVTVSEATAKNQSDYLPAISNIRAGSWINSNFNIWIGHQEDIDAWSLLGKAREFIIKNTPDATQAQLDLALENVRIAEGSDWFWWYGDDHHADNEEDFDNLFRYYIAKVYEAMGADIPKEVYIPIKNAEKKTAFKLPMGNITPTIDGMITNLEEWENAGSYFARSAMTAMHQIGEILDMFYFGADEKFIYFRMDLLHSLNPEDSIIINFSEPVNFQVLIKGYGISLHHTGSLVIESLKFGIEEIVEFALPRHIFVDLNNNKIIVGLNIETKCQEGELQYPRQGVLKLEF